MSSVYRAVLLFGGFLVLTGCFNRLDTNAVEQEIEAEIESQSRRIALAEVRCPQDVYRQSGAYFRCVGKLRPEGQFTINVTQKDSQGTVEWDVPNSQVILNLAKIEDTLQEDFAKQFSKRAVVDCGEQYRINQPGEQFECQVVGGVDLGQEQVTALLVRVDPDGNLNWYEIREAITPVASATDSTDESATEANEDNEEPAGNSAPTGSSQTGSGQTGSETSSGSTETQTTEAQ